FSTHSAEQYLCRGCRATKVVFAALQQANSPATAVPILQLFGEIVILCRAHGSAFPEGQVSEQSANSAPRRFKMVINPQITQSAAALESPISKTASLQLEKCAQFLLELTADE
ncbi:MAG: hypothetical protein ACK46M_04270, partial [Planctomyces sp.]